MDGTSFNIEEVLLGVLGPLFVGKRVRASRRRKPRLCTGVEMAAELLDEFSGQDLVRLKYEDGTTEDVYLCDNVEVFEGSEITVPEARRLALAASERAQRERVDCADEEAARESYGDT